MNISRKNNSKITFVFVMTLICNSAFAQNPVQIDVTNKHAKIENNLISIEFDLSDGTYSGIDKTDHTTMFKEAWYRIGQGKILGTNRHVMCGLMELSNQIWDEQKRNYSLRRI